MGSFKGGLVSGVGSAGGLEAGVESLVSKSSTFLNFQYFSFLLSLRTKPINFCSATFSTRVSGSFWLGQARIRTLLASNQWHLHSPFCAGAIIACTNWVIFKFRSGLRFIKNSILLSFLKV